MKKRPSEMYKEISEEMKFRFAMEEFARDLVKIQTSEFSEEFSNQVRRAVRVRRK